MSRNQVRFCLRSKVPKDKYFCRWSRFFSSGLLISGMIHFFFCKIVFYFIIIIILQWFSNFAVLLLFFPPIIFISWRLITLQYCSGFLPYIDMNQPWIYMCSPSHPSGSSQCTSPEHLSVASNLDWQSVSHLIIYMFRCCSHKSSHPRILP